MTPEKKGALRPTLHRFALGEAEITTILDGAHIRTPINPPFAMDMTEARIAAIASANHLPAHGFENTYTPTLISLAGQLVLFDTGFGPKGRDTGAGHLRARLAEMGHAPEDIEIVAFTHCHPDHIAGVMEGDRPAYPNASYVIGRREYDAWLSGDGIPESRQQNRDLFLTLLPPLAERMRFVEDGDSLLPGLTAEAAFGHSMGHMMYRVESAGASLLIWGDVTNHYVFSLQYPDSPVGFDDEKDMARTTRKRVLDMVATDGLLVSGHHMPFPAIGHVDRAGDSYRWVPASFQLRL